MEEEFVQQMDALFKKYSELLTGTGDEETKEKVKVWALYTHIAKSMPALARHWNELYPGAREQMKHLVQEIKSLNEQHRNSRNQ